MKSIGNDCYLDDNGQLYITVPGVADPFAPPGAEAAPVLQATGYTFEDVPTYGWPLGVIYRNNPLQFASEATAESMARRARTKLTLNGDAVAVRLEEVKVGPYTWKPIRKLTVRTPDGKTVSLNAGLLASSIARSAQAFETRFADEVAKEWAKQEDAQ